MSPLIRHLILISLLLIIHPHPTTSDQSFISVLITQNGLDFVKNLLVSKTVPKITPSPLSQIDRAITVPVIGNVHIVLSDISIYRFNVGLSQVMPRADGVTIAGSEVTCDLSMKWHYSCGSSPFPISISDSGTASIEVDGMEMVVTLGLDIREGSLKLSTDECNCHIHDISVDLDGGASWLYQGDGRLIMHHVVELIAGRQGVHALIGLYPDLLSVMCPYVQGLMQNYGAGGLTGSNLSIPTGILDAFREEIVSTVEKAITKILKTEISKLESLLQSLPKQIPVDDLASLNVTLVNNPFLSDTSLGFEINGLFIENKTYTRSYGNSLQPPVRCLDPSKMIGIAIDEAVFKSAFSLYYDAMFMHWTVDTIPEQSLLNTAGWRFIVPQLYRKYPNDNMSLNLSLSEPPGVQISLQKIDAVIYADLIINVLEADDTIPVVCISLVITGTSSVQITGNNLAAHLKMDDFTMSLKWSKIGTLHMFLIQPVVWTIVETVFLPYVNARIGIGFPLPIISGFMLRNAEITTSDSRITVCSDVTYEELFDGIRVYDS